MKRLVVAIVLIILTTPSAFALPNYYVIDLGVLPGYETATEAFSINNEGLIAGSALSASRNAWGAFIWKDGSFTELEGFPDYEKNVIYGINNIGQAVGASRNQATDDEAVLWDTDGNMIRLGFMDVSTARAINDRGQIVGIFRERGFVWENGSIIYLLRDTHEAEGIQAYGINNEGQVVGLDTINNKAFIWENGDMKYLDSGGGISSASHINDLGQAVGYSTTYTGLRATLWDNGTVTDLGDIPGGDDY